MRSLIKRPAVPEGPYLSPEELTARWRGKISIETLANWRSQKKGPRFTKIGSRVLYPLADIQAYESKNIHK